MSNPEILEQIATKLNNLRTSILDGQIRDENLIAEKLKKIREYAEENEIEFIVDDDEYIELLKDGGLGEESESEEYSQSYDEDDEGY